MLKNSGAKYQATILRWLGKKKMNQIRKNAGKLFVSSLCYCLLIFQNNNVKEQVKILPTFWLKYHLSFLPSLISQQEQRLLSLPKTCSLQISDRTCIFFLLLNWGSLGQKLYLISLPPLLCHLPIPVLHSARSTSGLNNKHQWFLCVRHHESP